MKRTKIEWCDCTVNPVVGCKRGCSYCYAKRLNDRFGFVNKWEEPRFFVDRLQAFNSKKLKAIFINSMSDIDYWTKEQADAFFEVASKNTQHEYIALTKGWLDGGLKYMFRPISQNHVRLYIGITAATQARIEQIKGHIWKFPLLNIEPIQERLDLSILHSALHGREYYNIIVGAETGNRKDKIIPNKEWIMDIVEFARERNINLFMKDNLHKIMGADFAKDKLTWRE